MPNQGTMWDTYRLPIVALLLLVLALGAWFIYKSASNNEAAAVVLADQFDWDFDRVESEEGVESTVVVLEIAGVDIPVGSIPGRCDEIDGENWKLLPNELSGIICETSEGQGVEIGVFDEGEGLVLKQGTVVGGERSNFVPMSQQEFETPEETP